MNKTAETRKLVAHEKLLIDVIKRQAGSLEKAILEGTMNSVEAGATEIDINFMAEKSKDNNPNPAFLSIYDDGIGIRTKEELVKHFETFGQPHETDENVIWKQFRMGRGQMFAFGKNVWRTSTFKMEVDVDNRELDYDLYDGLEPINGCLIDIELYKNPLDNYTIFSVKYLKEKVKEQVRYVKIPVKFNDEVISVDPATLDWDYEDEYSYYKFADVSYLKIYNLGVYVMSRTIKDAGVGGIIVSKQMLKVNFARNDVDSTCPVYEQINQIVEENKIKRATKKYKSMSADERYNLLAGLRDADDYHREYEGKRILRLANDKWISWKMFMKDNRPWCFAPLGDRVADKAMQMNTALCFDINMMDEMGYDGEYDQFFNWLWSDSVSEMYEHSAEIKKKELKRLSKKYLCFSDSDVVSDLCSARTLSEAFSQTYSYIPYGNLRKTEKRILDVLNGFCCWNGRKIGIGVSDIAVAWTDGSTHITLERNWLKSINVNAIASVLNLFTTLCHEMAHDDDSAGTHVHGGSFYENYYEITHERNYWQNPLVNVYTFSKNMNKYRIDQMRMEEEEKERKLKEELQGV